jgi:TonB family protein
LQGTTRLEITRGPSGQPALVRLASSSGWGLLDDAALILAKKCQFSAAGKGLSPPSDTLTINWSIPPDELAPQPPVLQEYSCQKSTLFKRGPNITPADRLRVRLLVWQDGQVVSPKLEGGSGDATIDKLSSVLTPAARDPYQASMRCASSSRASC